MDYLTNNLIQQFPSNIINDGYILYHGTSSFCEDSINSEGLLVNHSRFTLDELRSIADLFNKLNWKGISGGSYAVLMPFSISHDFQKHDNKPVYLTPFVHQAYTYASLDFAGGEIAHTVRSCFKELWQYVLNPAVREQHLNYLASDVHGKGVNSIQINIVELRRSLEYLSPIFMRARELKEKYLYGLVYAIRFDEKDFIDLRYNSFMGVKCFKSINPKQVACVVKLPREFTYSPNSKLDILDFPAFEGIISKIPRD